MKMCYDGTLVMPSSYAVMDEEEMTYVEGGDNVYKMNLSEAKKYFQIVLGSGVGFCMLSSGLKVGPVIAIGQLYYGSLVSDAKSCLKKCEKWIKKYGANKMSKVTEYTMLKFIFTGYDIKIA